MNVLPSTFFLKKNEYLFKCIIYHVKELWAYYSHPKEIARHFHAAQLYF